MDKCWSDSERINMSSNLLIFAFVKNSSVALSVGFPFFEKIKGQGHNITTMIIPRKIGFKTSTASLYQIRPIWL